MKRKIKIKMNQCFTSYIYFYLKVFLKICSFLYVLQLFFFILDLNVDSFHESIEPNVPS